MTAPRCVVPGTTYLVTRRCARRQFLLRPSAETTGIFTYVLALAVKRFGVRLHAVCVLSNHFHLIVTDPGAHLPAFSQYLDSLVARAVNASLGRWESFWAPSSYSAVALAGPEDVVAKTAYVLANPVAAGLVRFGHLWPGLRIGPDRVERITAHRPAAFFRARGGLPEAVELALEPPPGFASADAFRREVAAAHGLLEQEATREHAQSGRGFLGAARVLAQSWWARPREPERHRDIRPRVAAIDRWKRIEALGRLVGFMKAYREARLVWSTGRRDVLFPFGTYLLRVTYGVPCAAGP